MKIVIEHMGPVEYFELDLDRPLTVIYGGNNIGKSYAMQVCYLLMKHLFPKSMGMGPFFYASTHYFSSQQAIHTGVTGIIHQFYKDSLAEKHDEDITERVSKLIIDSFFIHSFGSFVESCKNTFRMIDNPENISRLQLFYVDFVISIDFHNKTITSDYEIQTRFLLQKRPTAGRQSWETKNYFRIYMRDNEYAEIQRLEMQVIKEFYTFQNTIASYMLDIYYLPSSRSGIYIGLSAVTPVIAQLSQNRSLIHTEGFAIPRISEPVSDYYLNLINVSKLIGEPLKQHAETLEKKILDGFVIYNEARGDYQYRSKDGIDYELTQTSSMIAEVSLITAYLKYITPNRSSTVIFIEEPEAHLHPENQVRLVEVFAKLANEVKLVISSHSNYIFNKLNNMALDRQIDEKIYNPILMKFEGTGGKAHSLKVTSVGVRDENFMDITERLWEEREEIIERRNREVPND